VVSTAAESPIATTPTRIRTATSIRVVKFRSLSRTLHQTASIVAFIMALRSAIIAILSDVFSKGFLYFLELRL
jgi:hypothetical protein